MTRIQEIINAYINSETSLDEFAECLANQLRETPYLYSACISQLHDMLDSDQLDNQQYLYLQKTLTNSHESDSGATTLSPANLPTNSGNGASDDSTIIQSDSTLLRQPPQANNNNDASSTIIRAIEKHVDTEKQDDATHVAENDSTVVQATNTSSFANESDDDKTQMQSPISNEQGETLQVGTTLKGRFVLVELLGEGGMGMVFKARDLRKEEAQDRNPFVAIKVLSDTFKDHPQAFIALQREARKAQTLAHPNIVTVYDFDRDGDTVFMTMEFLEGQSLDHILYQHRPSTVKHDVALKVVEGICNGLAYAHENNIIHSDLKPGNVFVTDDGAVKVFDFGIARAMKGQTEEVGDTTLFDAGSLGGLTPAYASYEMLEGQEPDSRDDIYALACISFELFTGKHPFNKLPANKAQQKNLRPPTITHIKKGQNKAIEAGLSFDREKRTPSVNEFSNQVLLKSRKAPIIYALASLIVIVSAIALFNPINNYLAQQKIDRVVSALNSGQTEAINSSLRQIQKLDNDTRVAILKQAKDILVDFYKKRALQEIDITKDQYNFVAALRILNGGRLLYPDSAQLSDAITLVNNRKNQILNELALRFDQALSSGNLVNAENKGDGNIKNILDNIAKIDSNHHLLKDPRLIVAFYEQTRDAFDDWEYDKASTGINIALSIFPKNKRLLGLKTRIDSKIKQQSTLVLNEHDDAESKLNLRSAKEYRNEINDKLKQPFSSKRWSNKVLALFEKITPLLPNNDEWVKSKKEQFAKIHFNRGTQLRRQQNHKKARSMILLAKQFKPDIQGADIELKLIKKKSRNYALQKKNSSRNAKVAGLKQTLLTHAKANDVKSANNIFKKLKPLLPEKDPFILKTAPNSIAKAYLRLGNGLAKRRDYYSAVALYKTGLEFSPNMKALNKAYRSNRSKVVVRTNHDQSGDPCRRDFAGLGKRSKATCYDKVDNQQGPVLVVIPAGKRINKPFAIGKYEISVNEFNFYCKQNSNCRSLDQKSNLPATGISIKQARAYATWLSSKTGFKYRLPSEQEWIYAANAQGKQPKKDFNCRFTMGNSVLKGNSLLSVKSGKKNGWGLSNYVGNAQEWVLTSARQIVVRGGAFQDPLKKCDVSLSKTHNGQADLITGFRLVREFK